MQPPCHNTADSESAGVSRLKTAFFRRMTGFQPPALPGARRPEGTECRTVCWHGVPRSQAAVGGHRPEAPAADGRLLQHRSTGQIVLVLCRHGCALHEGNQAFSLTGRES